MLAREVPLLKGKQLCAFLEQMDQEEQGLATQERQAAAEQVRVLNESHKVADIFNLTSGVGGFAGMAVSVVYENKMILAGNSRNWHFFVSLGFGVLTVVGMTRYVINGLVENSLSNRLISEILSSEICRLDDKVNRIEKALLQNPPENENDQLTKAKTFFNLKKMEMIASKTKTIDIQVRYA